MARNRQPVLKKCRALGIDPVILGVNNLLKEGQDQTLTKNLQSTQFN